MRLLMLASAGLLTVLSGDRRTRLLLSALNAGLMGVLVCGLTLVGCRKPLAGGETVTYIVITDEAPRNRVSVRPGGEVRWTNTRSVPVRVVLLSPARAELSCNRGFARFMEPVDSALLAPGASASACFADPGAVRYAIPAKTDRSSIGRAGGLVLVEEERPHPMDEVVLNNGS